MKNSLYVLIFLYFFTLICDQLYFEIDTFRLKLSHLSGAAFFLLFVAYRKEIRLNTPLALYGTLLFLSILISSLFSVYPLKSVTYAFVWMFIFFVYLVLPMNLMRLCEPRLVMKLYLSAYYVLGSYAFLQVVCSIGGLSLPFSAQTLIYNRGCAFAQEPSFYAMYAIPIVTFLNMKALLTHKVNKITLLCANLFLLASTTSTCIVSYLVFLATLLCFPTPKKLKRNALKLIGALALLLLVAYPFIGDFLQVSFFKFLSLGLDVDSFQVRFNGIKNALTVFGEYPLFGVGLGGAGPYLYGQTFFPHYTGSITTVDPVTLESFDPTNIFTEILACLGIFGLGCITLLLHYFFKTIKTTLSHPQLPEEEKNEILSLLVSVVVMLIVMQINQGLFRSYVWVHLGLTLGYVLRAQHRLNPQEEKGKDANDQMGKDHPHESPLPRIHPTP